MARPNIEGADRIYDVAQVFCRQALRADDSMLSPGRRIWTSEGLDVLHKRFTEQWDGSEASFEVKLESQLQGTGDQVTQLMAELVLMHLLINIRIGGASKRQLLGKVLGWMETPVSVPAAIDGALDFGLAWPGMFFNLGRDRQIRFLIEWMRSWKALDADERERALADPWAFKEQAHSVDDHGGWIQRTAILHMVFPDTFERIMLTADKEAVLKAFADRIGGLERAQSLDEDKALLEVRAALSKEFGPDFDFYTTPEVETLWRAHKKRGEDEDAGGIASPAWNGAYWWVNQGTTYKAEKAGGYLWAPQKNKDGVTFQHWSDLQKPAPDDLVFNYANGAIRAISRVISPAVQRVQPDGLEEGGWEREGYLLSVEYRELEKPLALNDIPVSLRAGGPGPFTVVGGVKQGYFFPVAQAVGAELEQRARGVPESGITHPVQQPLEDSMTDAQAIYDKLCTPECDVRFPEWIVSDYLLSLSAKPFVLLSGISGTGKTQIALKVAELLAGEDEVLEAGPVKRDDPNAVYHTVGKSTLAYGLVVPREKDYLFMDVQPGPSTEVVVRTDSGEFDAHLGRVAFSSDRQPVMRLMWRKPSLEWIQATAQLGDVLEMKQAADDPLVIDVRVLKPHRSTSVSNARRIALVPVRADWTDNRDLLGFYNVLTEKYEPTDLLRVLLRAVEEPEKLHFVILDEMNLAKVEYYFADFLSAMETMEHGQGIPLHDHDEDVVIDLDGNDRVVPKRLPIPANVFFTGTVNIDETTHMFSRKVLDRANVIEFHDVDVRRHIGLSSPAKWSPALRLTDGTDVAKMLTQDRDRARERAVLSGKLAQRIVAIHDILAEYNLHFGYRVVDECARFLWLTKAHAGAEHLDGALDLQVLQKVLPKLAGNRSELQEPLERMLSYFATGEDSVLDLGDSKSIREYDLAGALMPLSAAKIRRMLERLTAVGFTSFVE